ncbi:MAG: GNAT family N-acetyltransferase [Oscillospiraceae bacterium]|nr:GNAT family N-acetyltransferase [Oscillospiraceae bacterium]
MLEYSNSLSAKEYCELRAAVGWQTMIEEQAQSGLEHSDFMIACRDGHEIVGCARVFWDKGYIAYLADVMVKPEYQKQGIGKRMVSACISFIDSQLKDGWRIKIVIVSAKGKESFYEKFGFEIRPNINDGAGMQVWRTL